MAEHPNLTKLINSAIFALRAVLLALEEFKDDDSGGGISDITRLRIAAAADSLADAADLLTAKRLN